MKLIILTMFLFVGCAGVPKSQKASKSNYLSGNSIEGVKLSSIEKDLTRAHAPSTFGGYSGSATLITEPYIRVYENEIGKRSYVDQAKIDKKITSRLQNEVENHTCFKIGIGSTAGTSEGVEVADFKNWKAKLKVGGQIHDIQYKKVGEAKRLEASGTQMALLGPGGTAYLNQAKKVSALGCTKNKVDPKSKMTLILIPQFGDENNKNIEMTWN